MLRRASTACLYLSAAASARGPAKAWLLSDAARFCSREATACRVGQRLRRRVALGCSLDARGSANVPLGDFAASPHVVSRLQARFRPRVVSVIPLMRTVNLGCSEDAGVHQNPHYLRLDRGTCGNTPHENVKSTDARSVPKPPPRRRRGAADAEKRHGCFLESRHLRQLTLDCEFEKKLRGPGAARSDAIY